MTNRVSPLQGVQAGSIEWPFKETDRPNFPG
jgi:hypothetical protein